MRASIKKIVVADNYEAVKDGNMIYLHDVLEYGCRSGIVSRLIYFKDTLSFYKDHREELSELIKELVDETGLRIDELIANWDCNDPLVIETNNQNLIAWYGYEAVARMLIDEVP